jgi:hypothetical protein
MSAKVLPPSPSAESATRSGRTEFHLGTTATPVGDRQTHRPRSADWNYCLDRLTVPNRNAARQRVLSRLAAVACFNGAPGRLTRRS